MDRSKHLSFINEVIRHGWRVPAMPVGSMLLCHKNGRFYTKTELDRTVPVWRSVVGGMILSDRKVREFESVSLVSVPEHCEYIYRVLTDKYARVPIRVAIRNGDNWSVVGHDEFVNRVIDVYNAGYDHQCIVTYWHESVPHGDGDSVVILQYEETAVVFKPLYD